MLKFFRRIRRKLLEEVSLRKYFIYAAGEILLVVLGILIALQINNWNEQRKENIANDRLIEAFEKDLEKNIQESNRVINWNYERDSLFLIALSPSFQSDTHKIKDDWITLITFWNTPLRVRDNLDILLKKDNFSKKYRNIVSAAKTYSYLMDEEIQIESKIKDFIFQVNEFLDTEFPVDKRRESFHEYVHSNTSSFPNKVITARRLTINSFNRRLLGRRNLEAGLLNEIRKIKNGLNTNQQRRFLGQLGLVPFKGADCSKMDYEFAVKLGGMRNSFLIINQRDQDVTIFSLDNKGNRLVKFLLEPGDFITSYIIGMNSHYVGTGFELVEGDKCIQKYLAVKDGFLMIE